MGAGRKSTSPLGNRRKVTIYLDPEIDTYLQDMVKNKHVTLNQAVNVVLRRAMMRNDEERWWQFLGPQLEQIIRREIRGMSNRLAGLLIHTVLEGISGSHVQKQILTILAEQEIESSEVAAQEVNRIRREARAIAVNTLKHPPEDFREVFRDITVGESQ